jgi:pyrophosphatase PpaX
MPAAAPRTILFDVDGTLIDTYRLYLEAYRRALAPYVGRLPSADEVAAQRPTSERHFLVEWLGESRAAACHDAMCTAYEELHGALCEGPYEGVREMLQALRTAGLEVGVVTGKGRRAWEITERELGLGPFAVVITEDEMEAPKPDPGGLLAAARHLEVDPAEVVYIGDSLGDAGAGRAAGMRVGGALWPKSADGERERFLDDLRPFAPDWVFDRPADVTRAFAPWC